ncbi:hypothetical protein [Pseudoflavonifractor sp. MSJ-37]|uniref:hypothetical protein n=1 Tax=Pseudoflavonifractor sp. MSJ-37 TaxID=2841531 RepID=UPI001C0FF2F0|nr:hypothetical protein [Pseudoflavonifractor sp. MSJ-37]MBU5435538.1 hypothetical protein [Pseudoflavonifractor sp. MSJ-37]
MKNLNTMKFVSNAIEELVEYKAAIAGSKTFDEAKNTGRMMAGYINGLITFLNTMICEENNDFTAEFDEVLDGWMFKMYDAVADKAIETNQDKDTIWKLLVKRDEYTMM